jgi:hypothetical protein
LVGLHAWGIGWLQASAYTGQHNYKRNADIRSLPSEVRIRGPSVRLEEHGAGCRPSGHCSRFDKCSQHPNFLA